MKFFTKYTQAVEGWLRAIVRDEVNRVDTSMQREKEALQSHLQVFDEQITKFNGALDRILESSYFVENTELRATIKELTSKFAAVTDTIKKLHPELVK